MFNRFTARYSLVKDTLRLSITQAPDDYADFLLDTTKVYRLSLAPLNGSAKQIAKGITSGTDEGLVFHNIQQDHTDSIKFEKIIYKQVGGYHSDPAIVYEIGKVKK